MYMGYPVIKSLEDPNLLGYVARKDLINFLRPALKITFDDDQNDPFCLNLSEIVDKTPISVDPRVQIEFVIDLFKKVGMRVLLVKQYGKLCG